MGSIEVSTVVEIVDKVTAWYVTVLGTESSGKGIGASGGTFGGAKKAEDLEGLGVGTGDYDIIAILGPAFRSLRNASDVNALSAAYLASSINALSSACAAAGTANEWSGVADLDSFATYHNLTTTTKWQCLLPPDFYAAYGAATQRTLSAFNVYYEVLQGTGSDGLGKLVVGTGFSSPGSIDSTKYAGGTGQLKVTGLSGSGVVTVAGSWRKTDGSTGTGNGTATVTTSGTVALTPPFTGALLLAVTNITAVAEITGGTLYAEAARPSGRDNPPT